MSILEQVKVRREAKGLRLCWYIPAEQREFTAYPANEDQKLVWLAQAESRGWLLRD